MATCITCGADTKGDNEECFDCGGEDEQTDDKDTETTADENSEE